MGNCDKCGRALPEMGEREREAQGLSLADDPGGCAWELKTFSSRRCWLAIRDAAWEMFAPKPTTPPEAQPAARYEPDAVEWKALLCGASSEERVTAVRTIIASAEREAEANARDERHDLRAERDAAREVLADERSGIEAMRVAHAKEVAELESVCAAKQEHIDKLNTAMETISRDWRDKLDRIRKEVG